MRKEQAAPDVVVIKLLLLIISFVLVSNTLYAQNDNYEFQKNFVRHFKYPMFYRNSCNPTYANMLVEVSKKGQITNISISDSARKFFKDEFNEIKDSINTAPLDSIIVKKKLKNCSIIIPIFYIYETDWCVNSFEGFISDSYLKFNGKEINGLTYNLKPIFVNMYKPVE